MKPLLITLICLSILSTSQGQYTSTDTLSYYSAYFKAKRHLKVSLPEEYADYPNRKYKVIYLFDAQSTALYEFTKATLSFFPGYANFYYDPVILVGIETGNRHFEFLPRHVNTLPGPHNYPAAGGADTLALSIENELKPLIEKRYRTNGFSIGIGHSLGGTFVTYSMLKFPKVFNAGICISPNYVYDKEVLLTSFTQTIGRNNNAARFLYISYGYGDETEENFRKSTIKFGKLLEVSKVPNLNYLVDRLNNNSHSTTPMEGIFKGLVYINNFMTLPYEKYKPLLDSSSKVSFIDYIRNYFENSGARVGMQLPSIGELNTIAYNAFNARRIKDAIQVLEWGISLYPNDSNLFDSMGEMQENAGDTEKAKYYYQKGLSVVESQRNELQESSYNPKLNWFKERLNNIEKK